MTSSFAQLKVMVNYKVIRISHPQTALCSFTTASLFCLHENAPWIIKFSDLQILHSLWYKHHPPGLFCPMCMKFLSFTLVSKLFNSYFAWNCKNNIGCFVLWALLCLISKRASPSSLSIGHYLRLFLHGLPVAFLQKPSAVEAFNLSPFA